MTVSTYGPDVRRIALVAHDNRKQDMLEWAAYNRATLARHELSATATTGRGRLVEVNGAPFASAQLGDERARRLGEREFNLSWSEALPAGNRVVAGKWWQPEETGAAAGASLEESIAKTLGLKLGDRPANRDRLLHHAHSPELD